VDGDFLRIWVRPRRSNGLRLAEVLDLHDDVGFHDLVQRLARRARGKVEGLDEIGEGAEPAGEWGFGLGFAGVSGCVFGCLQARGCTSAVCVTDEDDC
jgi:hypothetical protein